jgi:hypothetical protein
MEKEKEKRSTDRPSANPATPVPAIPEQTDQIDCLPRVNDIVTNEKANRKYRLVAELDKGGFGVVFEATDDKR